MIAKDNSFFILFFIFYFIVFFKDKNLRVLETLESKKMENF